MIPIRYNLRSLGRRRMAFLMTTSGIAVVVALFAAMLSLAEGVRKTFETTGDPRNLVIMRRGTLAEPMSIVERETAAVLAELPGVRRDEQGRSLASSESMVLWMVADRQGKDQQIGMRGVVVDAALAVHPKVRLVSGQMFRHGQNEVIVGRALAGRFSGLELGGRFRWGRREWTTVGIFAARGSAFESEVWGDLDGVLDDDHRTEFSSVTLPIDDASLAPSLEARIEADRRFSLRAQTEPAYYRSQAGSAQPILTASLTVALIMGVAAVFGALNTMYASLAGRRREVATLRAIGFSRRAIAFSFVLESLLQTVPAGLLGCLLALAVHGHSTSMLSPMTFTSVAFSFRTTPLVFLSALAFSLLIGLVCGGWPAYSAGKLSISAGLRD